MALRATILAVATALSLSSCDADPALTPPPMALGSLDVQQRERTVVIPDAPAPRRPPPAPLIPPTPPPPPDVRIVFDGPRAARKVALTFDDGPSAELTPRILDVLAYYQVRATFFVLGRRIEDNEGLLRRMHDEGHEIGNHGWSHRSFRTLFKSELREEITRTDESIFGAAGVHPRLLRPPFGGFADSAMPIFSELGLEVVLWTVDSQDWDGEGAEMIETIVRDTRPGSIVLLHDPKPQTLRALPQIIGSLRAKGHELVTISELVGTDAYR